MITLNDNNTVGNDAINTLLINTKTPYAQQSHTVGNILAQIGRIPGGMAQGTIKALSAPGILKEAVDNRVRDKGQASSLKVKNEAVNAFNNGNAYTNFAAKANQGVENLTNSWVAPPETKAAEFAAVAFDTIGEAIPSAAAAIATGGNALVGNALSHGLGAATAFSYEMLEGSGDVGKAVVRAGTAYASEAIGGKLFGNIAGGNGIASWVGGAVGEGLEGNIDGVLFSAITGDSYTMSDAIQDFALETVAGAALGGVGKVTNTVNASVTPKLVDGNVNNRTANNTIADEASPFIAPNPRTPLNSNTTDFIPKNISVNDTGRAELRQIESQNDIAGRITKEMSVETRTYTGIKNEVNQQSLEFGYADSDGNAVPSTPDTEPWKFPDGEPNTIPFPDVPDADPNGTPAIDPQTIPFPSPAQPEPNIVPFPTPVQPDTDTPATDPEIIPFPSTPDPDVLPNADPDTAPNTVQFPQPEINPNITADPDVSPDINTEPDVLPQTSPVISPKTFPQERPQAEPIAEPNDEPVAQPIPQSEPGFAPSAVPITVPQEVPTIYPIAVPSTQTQPIPKAAPSAQPDTNPNIQAQPVQNEQPETETDPQARAKSIWMPESVARQANAAQPNPVADTARRDHKERFYGNTDFNILRGAGSTGRVYETAGYNTTFGGLSSY